MRHSTTTRYNGVAYSAEVTYSPPVYFNSDGTVNTTTYPSMTSANTSTWSLVPNDGYKVQSTSKSNLVGNASFYTFVPENTATSRISETA